MYVNRVGADVAVLADDLEVPGIGHLAMNPFVAQASEPVVVDTGLSVPGRGFLDALGSVVIRPTSSGSGSRTPTGTTPASASSFSTSRLAPG